MKASGTHLNISRQGEVLSEGVTLETVVRQNTSQVGMVGEEHAIHVPDLEAQTQGFIHESSPRWWSLVEMMPIYQAVEEILKSIILEENQIESQDTLNMPQALQVLL